MQDIWWHHLSTWIPLSLKWALFLSSSVISQFHLQPKESWLMNTRGKWDAQSGRRWVRVATPADVAGIQMWGTEGPNQRDMEVERKGGEWSGGKELLRIFLSSKVVQAVSNASLSPLPSWCLRTFSLSFGFGNLVKQMKQVFLSPFYSVEKLKDLPKVIGEPWGLLWIL